MNSLITSFKDIINKAIEKGPKKVAIAAAEDKHVLEAVKLAKEYKIISPILIGSKESIEKISKDINFNLSNIEIINSNSKEESAYKSSSLVNNGDADLLMKGILDTSVILRAVLNKDFNLRKEKILSHVGVLSVNNYERLFILSDSAMNIKPNMEDKIGIIKNTISVANALGIFMPKVALICPVEKANPKIESTLDAIEIVKLNKEGKITGCYISGPLALDNAVSIEAAKIKGIKDPNAGKAEILIPPDLASANILNKSMEYFAGAQKAGVIMGAKMPIILTSRASSSEAKLNSIALGVLCTDGRQ